MSTGLVDIYHFSNGTGGGVLTYIRNLIEYNTNPRLRYHVIYALEKDHLASFQVPVINGVSSQIVFSYSKHWNFYQTISNLAKLTQKKEAILVAHDWLELGMIHQLGLNRKVVFVLHGDYPYYYQLAEKHQSVIDSFVGVSEGIVEHLKKILPARNKDIECLRAIIPNGDLQIRDAVDHRKVVFLGRCSKEKGFDLLPKIAKLANDEGAKLTWHIIGKGELLQEVSSNWPASINGVFHGELENLEVRKLLIQMDFMVLPSLAEGLPLSVVEAMKYGVVPLVNNCSSGVRELISHEENGFLITDNSPRLFANYLLFLYNSPNTKDEISLQSFHSVNETFSVAATTGLVAGFFEELHSKVARNKVSKKVYGSRLDERWIPNFIVAMVRSIINRSKV